MSYEVKTTTGERMRAGFWSTDTSSIMLGDLPPIGIDQFSQYASEVVTQVLGSLDDETRTAFEQFFTTVKRRTAERPVRVITPTFAGVEDQSDAISALDLAKLVGDDVEESLAFEGLSKITSQNLAMHYGTNPFLVKENGSVLIGDYYEVEPKEFAYLTVTYLGGGHMGWDPTLGVPASAVAALDNIDSAIQNPNA